MENVPTYNEIKNRTMENKSEEQKWAVMRTNLPIFTSIDRCIYLSVYINWSIINHKIATKSTLHSSTIDHLKIAPNSPKIPSATLNLSCLLHCC